MEHKINLFENIFSTLLIDGIGEIKTRSEKLLEIADTNNAHSLVADHSPWILEFAGTILALASSVRQGRNSCDHTLETELKDLSEIASMVSFKILGSVDSVERAMLIRTKTASIHSNEGLLLDTFLIPRVTSLKATCIHAYIMLDKVLRENTHALKAMVGDERAKGLNLTFERPRHSMY